jgi:hypothetical protein
MIKTPKRDNQEKAIIILQDILYIALAFSILILTLNIPDLIIRIITSP